MNKYQYGLIWLALSLAIAMPLCFLFGNQTRLIVTENPWDYHDQNQIQRNAYFARGYIHGGLYINNAFITNSKVNGCDLYLTIIKNSELTNCKLAYCVLVNVTTLGCDFYRVTWINQTN